MAIPNSSILNQNALTLSRASEEFQLVSVYCNQLGKVTCEGFKLDKKLKSELKKDCSSFKAYGVKLSDVEYAWEIKKPMNYEYFDHRFNSQLTDPYGMNITGYGYNSDGDPVPQETFLDCIITDFGRDYEGGVEPSLKGIALGWRGSE